MKTRGTSGKWLVFGLVMLVLTSVTRSEDELPAKNVGLQFRNVGLQEAISQLAREAEFTVRFEASAQDKKDKKITLVTDEQVPLRTALQMVTTYAGLHYMIKGGEVVVYKTLEQPAQRKKQEAEALEAGGIEWVARSYDVSTLIQYNSTPYSPFRRRRIGDYLKTGGHPTYTELFDPFVIDFGYGEIVSYEGLYHGLTEQEFEEAVRLNRARSLIFKVMNTINPGIWAPPIIFGPVTEVVAPELAGIPMQQSVERAVAAGKSGIIIYRDGIMTVLVKKGTELKTQYAGLSNKKTLRTSGGIGITVKVSKEGYLLIESVSKGNPAALAGLRNGDVILAVDGKNIGGMTFAEVARRITGPVGTRVRISILRTDPLEKKTFDVLRVPLKD